MEHQFHARQARLPAGHREWPRDPASVGSSRAAASAAAPARRPRRNPSTESRLGTALADAPPPREASECRAARAVEADRRRRPGRVGDEGRGGGSRWRRPGGSRRSRSSRAAGRCSGRSSVHDEGASATHSAEDGIRRRHRQLPVHDRVAGQIPEPHARHLARDRDRSRDPVAGRDRDLQRHRRGGQDLVPRRVHRPSRRSCSSTPVPICSSEVGPCVIPPRPIQKAE